MPASIRQQREVAQRRERVLSLRAAGLTYQQIADQEPTLASASAAVIDAQRALAKRARERLAESDHLSLELERIALLERTAQTVMRQAAAGSQNPVLVLKAIDRLSALSARRSRLLGLGDYGRRNGAQRAPNPGLDEVAQQRAKRRAEQGW